MKMESYLDTACIAEGENIHNVEEKNQHPLSQQIQTQAKITTNQEKLIMKYKHHVKCNRKKRMKINMKTSIMKRTMKGLMKLTIQPCMMMTTNPFQNYMS